VIKRSLLKGHSCRSRSQVTQFKVSKRSTNAW